MQVLSIIEKVRGMAEFAVQPPSGLPRIRPEHVLPEDVRAFYGECGGFAWRRHHGSTRWAGQTIELWDSFCVLAPELVVLANPVLVAIPEEKRYESGVGDDISWDWYTIAQDGHQEYVTIDLNPKRLGRCYDSFHETHAVPGSARIVGLSFTQFLTRLLAEIESAHDIEDQVQSGLFCSESLGDAYEDVDKKSEDE